MKELVTITIGWKGKIQKKTFQNIHAAKEWIRKNFDNIDHVNFHYFALRKAMGKEVPTEDILTAIRNDDDYFNRRYQ